MFNNSILGLRDKLKDLILTNTIHLLIPTVGTEEPLHPFPVGEQVHMLPYHYDTLVNYFYLFKLATNYSEATYNPERYGSEASIASGKPINVSKMAQYTSDYPHLPTQLVVKDVAKCNMFIAAVAWLSWDNFRWQEELPTVPIDLSYGLVLQFPDYIIPFCEFLLDMNRKPYLESIGMEQLDQYRYSCVKHTITTYNFAEFQVR